MMKPVKKYTKENLKKENMMEKESYIGMENYYMKEIL